MQLLGRRIFESLRRKLRRCQYRVFRLVPAWLVPFPFTVTVGNAPDEVCLALSSTVGVADANATSPATIAATFILII